MLDCRSLFSYWRRFVQFVFRIPKKLIPPGNSAVVRAGLVDNRDFQTLGVGLPLSSHVDMHSIWCTVPVGIKFGLDPQVLSYPLRLIFERINDLSFAIFEDCSGILSMNRGKIRIRCGAQGDQNRQQDWCWRIR